MDVFHNLDLVALGVIVAVTAVLGYSAYASDTHSATNRMFFFFALVTAAWGIVNYLSYQFSDLAIKLWLTRGILFFAMLQAFSLYGLFRAFPERERRLDRWERYVLIPATLLTAILTLTPAVFSGIVGASAAGSVAFVQVAPGIALFGILAVGLVIAALYSLIRKTRHALDTQRRAFDVVLAGVAVSFALTIAFNFVLAALLHDPSWVPYGALFMFPLVIAISYAIQRHHIFNVKAAASALLVCVLAVVSFLDVVFSTEFTQVVFRTGTFVLIIIAGLSLVRGVLKEIEQRELIEKQEKELEVANQQQESLLHFISHEVKGYLTKNEAAFAAIGAGDFGDVSAQLKGISDAALSDTRKGVATVVDILDASNLKKGTVAYNKQPYDLIESVGTLVHDLQGAAKEKGLELNFRKPVTGAYTFVGDEDKLARHVFRNVIDNSIKYTPSGSVTVEMAKTPTVYRVTVSDTGVGITPEDMQHLFIEGGHGKDSIRINVHSTGYGLYIARQVVEAHGGKIWAESEGAGKGSRFIVELPITI